MTDFAAAPLIPERRLVILRQDASEPAFHISGLFLRSFRSCRGTEVEFRSAIGMMFFQQSYGRIVDLLLADYKQNKPNKQ